MSTWAAARARVDPVAIIGSRVRLKREGRHWIARCPFHQDGGRPNLVLYPNGSFKCFACGAWGDVFNLVARLDGVSLREARQLVEAAVGIVPLAPVSTTRTDNSLAPLPQRDAVYRALLSACPLSPEHREHLRARGLSEEAIRASGYRTLDRGWHRDTVAALQAQGFDLTGVPGFVQEESGGWLMGSRGLMIPVRDAAGRIQGCQVRRDGGGRYRWLSSAGRPGGASPGSPAHLAGRAWAQPGHWLWITEGPLKADVAAFWLSAPVVGVAGVSSWRRALPLVQAVRPGVVILAFDQDDDPGTRAAVARHTEALARALAKQRMMVAVTDWPPGLKGVDDVLAACQPVRLRLWTPAQEETGTLN